MKILRLIIIAFLISPVWAIAQVCESPDETLCTDMNDNDGNGSIDCQDQSCSSDAACFVSCSDSNEQGATCRVFITRERFNGDLVRAAIARGFDAGTATPVPLSTGAFAADFICQNAADNENLGGTWQAWINSSQNTLPGSNNSLIPDGRWLNKSNITYALLDGTPIANDWFDLTDGDIRNPINRNERDVQIQSQLVAWTALTATGIRSGPDCINWRNDTVSNNGVHGNASVTDGEWSNDAGFVCGPPNTSTSLRLYCFEQ